MAQACCARNAPGGQAFAFVTLDRIWGSFAVCSAMSYDLKPMKAPRAAGSLLHAFVAIVENPVTGSLLADKLLRDAGIHALREIEASGPPLFAPPVFDRVREIADPAAPPADLRALARQLGPAPGASFRPESAADFQAAYAAGRTSPTRVAERFLEHVGDSEGLEPPMRLFIAQDADDLREQARASTARHTRGEPLGPLDGVPVAVKDELDQRPYPTTVGTSFLGREPVVADAEAVARLRAAGALLVGKTNMHEIGLGVTGLNPHHGAARNPYDPARMTGGSSSGPAATVAAGLCPIAVGADGGGSIRIPAALCGVVGLKPTFGRVSEHGAAPLCWSVAHVGPIAATVRDLALAYAAMAGPDPKDATSLRQPAPGWDGIGQRGLGGIRLGIFRPWFEDAAPAVVEICRHTLDALADAGAKIVEVAIPELGLLRSAHLVTIIAEMAGAHLAHYRRHRADYGADTRLNLALARRLLGYDYVHAQRLRARLCAHFAQVMAEVDAVVTPATACTAPLLAPDALHSGESNLEVTDQIMRFAPAGNFTGLPAMSCPAGYDELGLPVGLQLLGRAWEEHVLLRIAGAIEQQVERREPRVHYRYLA
ncbi:MAG: amidase [Deltaproteobacteria bacterium]|nr:amidase [Deltaproteobacteria bacterium]